MMLKSVGVRSNTRERIIRVKDLKRSISRYQLSCLMLQSSEMPTADPEFSIENFNLLNLKLCVVEVGRKA